MIEHEVEPGSEGSEYVRFHEAGATAAGEFYCAECGYGVAVQEKLPTCPMCGGRTWEPGSQERRPGIQMR